MELGLREWLIIGGVIVVLLIVLDGWRRMRGSSNRLKMKIDKSLSDLPDLPEESSFNPELPGGGARVVNGYGEPPSARQEPVFSNDPQPAAEPGFNDLNLSPVRKAKPDSSKMDATVVATKAPVKSPVKQSAAANNRSSSDNVPKPNTAAKPVMSPTQPLVTKPVEPASAFVPEQDPLFASADSFPPHHDGPSFDEMDEGVSAVRVVSAEVPANADKMPEQTTVGTTSTAEFVDNAIPYTEVDDVEDIPMVQHIVKPEVVAQSIETDDQPDIDDMFALDNDPELNADKGHKTSAYAVEEDNLIDSLPAGFQLNARDEAAADDDEHEFDYTRPVSELMRPKREDNNQLQQTMMDLPEHPEIYQRRVDPVAMVDKSIANAAPRDFVAETQRPSEHFSAIDDEEQTELTGLFTDEQPDAAPAPPAKPISQPPAAKAKETVELDNKADPAIGIKGQSLQKIPEADKVLVISVVASEGESSFSGRNLLQILLACGMRYGDMKIFHRYEDGLDKGAIQFSMTNALEPGYFDIDTMDSIETRGVTFFMSMEEPRDVMNAYECMLATASAVAKNLHGVLLDENRSTMRDQTKEHYRERIRKFEMRKLKKTTTA
ncbi:cell division protein ZipA [Amphritea sp.]|uniref:cell division protein ZipA n=1 Tax=Amphritea sp. TaxID=1872502 RepID=UPI003A9202F9